MPSLASSRPRRPHLLLQPAQLGLDLGVFVCLLLLGLAGALLDLAGALLRFFPLLFEPGFDLADPGMCVDLRALVDIPGVHPDIVVSQLTKAFVGLTSLSFPV